MPVTLTACEDNRVLNIVITDPWSIQEIVAVEEPSRAIIRAASHKVHTLLNIQSRQIPHGLFTIRPSAAQFAHPNNGQIVIAGAPSLLKAIGETMFKLAHYTRSTFFSTEEEAWEYLRTLIAEEKEQVA